jgi:hypothetical protein
MDQNEMSNLYRGPAIDASYQVSVYQQKNKKIERHNIAEILLKWMLSINQSINQSKNRFNMNRDINFSLFFFFFQILSQKYYQYFKFEIETF